MKRNLAKTLLGTGLFIAGLGLFGEAWENSQMPLNYLDVIDGGIGAALAYFGANYSYQNIFKKQDLKTKQAK